MTIALIIVAAWIAIGASVGFYEVRRGHWRWLWLLGAMAGPFAIPLARSAQGQEPYIQPVILDQSDHEQGKGLHVVVGVDGSDASDHATRTALELLGWRVGAVTLATAIDFETVNVTSPGTLGPEDAWDDRKEAEDMLSDAADRLASWMGHRPTTVLLAGKPSEALQYYAEEHEGDLLVVGCRGAGLTKRVIGSCASQLAHRSTVPIFMVPCDLAVEHERQERHAATVAVAG